MVSLSAYRPILLSKRFFLWVESYFNGTFECFSSVFKMYPVLPSLPIIGVLVDISMLGRSIINEGMVGQMAGFADFLT